jgi:cell division protein FtsL
MSKVFSSIIPVILTVLLILQIFNKAAAQDVQADIKIDTEASAAATIKGQFSSRSQDKKNFSLLREYAGTDGLGERVSDLKLETDNGRSVAFKMLLPGEYLA